MATVLVIDDDEDIRFVVMAALEDYGGHQVLSASSCAGAAEILAKHRPDLILLDVQMPGLDGPRTFERLKYLGLLRDTPVAFMTANGEAADQARYFKLGAVGAIIKPFDPRTLLEQVARLVSLRRIPRAATIPPT